jgi:hypothetical protein
MGTTLCTQPAVVVVLEADSASSERRIEHRRGGYARASWRM